MEHTVRSVRGGVRLLFDVLAGVVHTVERMHDTIARLPVPWATDPDPAPGAHGPIAAATYGAIRTGAGWIREALDTALELAVPASSAPHTRPATPETSFVAVLNGVFGDHLERTGNPLAIPMQFRSRAGVLGDTRHAIAAAVDEPTPNVVILLHGLCMSESGWHRLDEHALFDSLIDQLGTTPVYLRYNSGRRISLNGREFAGRLDRLIAEWPVPVESIELVGHSMGGLVARSACAYAESESLSWRGLLRSIVCLGTPHHGAPLERGGHLLNSLLSASPYVRPFAFGRIRSEGIRDLRHGNLLDEDWRDVPRELRRHDHRRRVPLADDVAHYFAAASLADADALDRVRAVGDLLVPVPSALGFHTDPSKRLEPPEDHLRVFPGIDHLSLLDAPEVVQQVVTWLGARDGRV